MKILYWDNEPEEIRIKQKAFDRAPDVELTGVSNKEDFLCKLTNERWDFILLDLLSDDQETHENDFRDLTSTYGYSLARDVRKTGIKVPILFITRYESVIENGLQDVQPAFIDSKEGPPNWIVSRAKQLHALYRSISEAQDANSRAQALGNKRLLITVAFLVFFTVIAIAALESFHTSVAGYKGSTMLVLSLAVGGGFGASVSELMESSKDGTPLVSVTLGAAVGLVLGLLYLIPLYISPQASSVSGGMILLGALAACCIGSTARYAWKGFQDKGKTASEKVSLESFKTSQDG